MLTDDAIVTLPNDKPRCCKIDSASIEDEQGRGDGAYSLLDIEGTPTEIGRAIGDSLKDCGLTNSTGPLYLNVRIKID